MGAICEDCQEDIMESDGCTLVTVSIDGTEYDRVPYSGYVRCHDCNCRPGHIHHGGCDMEICPLCGDQLMCCSCILPDDDGYFEFPPMDDTENGIKGRSL